MAHTVRQIIISTVHHVLKKHLGLLFLIFCVVTASAYSSNTIFSISGSEQIVELIRSKNYKEANRWLTNRLILEKKIANDYLLAHPSVNNIENSGAKIPEIYKLQVLLIILEQNRSEAIFKLRHEWARYRFSSKRQDIDYFPFYAIQVFHEYECELQKANLLEEYNRIKILSEQYEKTSKESKLKYDINESLNWITSGRWLKDLQSQIKLGISTMSHIIDDWYFDIFGQPVEYFEYPVVGIDSLILKPGSTILGRRKPCVAYGSYFSMEGNINGDVVKVGKGSSRLIISGAVTGTLGTVKHFKLPTAKASPRTITSITLNQLSYLHSQEKCTYALNTIKLAAGQTIKLPTGNYSIGNIELVPNSEIVCGPDVNIYLLETSDKEQIISIDGANFNANGESSLLTIWYGGPKTIILKNKTKFSGRIYAPNANVYIENNTQYRGKVVAQKLVITDQSSIDCE